MEEDVEAIQKVSHLGGDWESEIFLGKKEEEQKNFVVASDLRGAHVEEEWKGIFMEEEGNLRVIQVGTKLEKGRKNSY